MASDIVIIDNLIPKEKFDLIREYFTFTAKWSYAPACVSFKDNPNDFTDQQFCNMLFFAYQGVLNKEGMDVMMPVFEKIDVAFIARIKANFSTWTPTVLEREFHTDIGDYGHMTAIYYLNTCNGYTLFEDGQKCESVENRICVFPGRKRHCGTTTSNNKKRMVVNINYWPRRSHGGVPIDKT